MSLLFFSKIFFISFFVFSAVNAMENDDFSKQPPKKRWLAEAPKENGDAPPEKKVKCAPVLQEFLPDELSPPILRLPSPLRPSPILRSPPALWRAFTPSPSRPVVSPAPLSLKDFIVWNASLPRQ